MYVRNLFYRLWKGSIRIMAVVLVIAGLLGPQSSLPGAGLREREARVTGSDAVAAPGRTALADLPAGVQAALSETLGQEDPAYHAAPAGDGYRAANRAHGLALAWSEAGASIELDGLRWQVGLMGWGYGDRLQPVARAKPEARQNRIEYRRGAVTEWYANGPLGLEQGFTLASPPAANPNGEPLTLELAQAGDLRARPAGQGLALVGNDGRAMLTYGGLAAVDASGLELPAWLELEGEALLVRVDDGGAEYPLLVDPYVQQARLSPFGDAGDRFGYSVALSGDGRTALVGVPYDDVSGSADEGSAFVFGLLNGIWGLQARLPSTGSAGDQFGCAVALDGDGDVALVGAPFAQGELGMVYRYTRDEQMEWTEDSVSWTGPQVGAWFGAAVALSGDGLTGLVGAPRYQKSGYTYHGLVRALYLGPPSTVDLPLPYTTQISPLFGLALALSEDGQTALVTAPGADQAVVYTCSGNDWAWSQVLTAPDTTAGDHFGYSGDLSKDGTMALVGAMYDDVAGEIDQGSAHVFVLSGGAWSHQQALTAADGQAGDLFGAAVALDGNGDTAVVGARDDDVASADAAGAGDDQGSAYVFRRSNGTWSQTAQLVPEDGAAGDGLGIAVDLDSAGDTALTGAWKDAIGTSLNQGSAAVFEESSGDWTHLAHLTGPGGADSWYFGRAVALSGDGDTALVGALDEGLSPGAGQAYVFRRRGGVWLPQEKFEPPNGPGSETFGVAVALDYDGDTALVGEFYDYSLSVDYQGKAYVYVRGSEGWSQQTQLIALDSEAGDYFGWALALSADGNTALVGAPYDVTGAGVCSGTAVVFVRSGVTWAQQDQLADLVNGATGDRFGQAVALSGDGNIALIGASGDDIQGRDSQGSVYVFVRSGDSWQPNPAKLVAHDGDSRDRFGGSVALSSDGNTALIGADGDDLASTDLQGSAYVFVRNGSTWSELGSFTAPEGTAFREFGSAVALSGDGNTALVANNLYPYRAWIFVRNRELWFYQSELSGEPGHGCMAVALNGDGGTGIVGSPWYEETSLEGESAHIFSLPVRPVLTSPADGQSTGDDTPTLTWQPSANTAAYRLDLDGSVVDVGSATHYTPAALSPGPHTWSVVAVDALGNESPWSEEWSFTVVEEEAAYWIYLPLVAR